MIATDPRVGQLVGGKYLIEELLARGGMGLVYGARHLVTERRVAIKVLRLELLNRRELVWRVSAEGRLAAVAAHPNVVEVLDAGTDEGVPYVVQERLHGEPLEALLSEPLSLRVTIQALMPVINAVAHLHRSAVIHRDIKPTNIFLARDANGRLTPKLLDFGIAKVMHGAERTLSGIALGTPAYMAPEQALGSRALGPASDVWSMAVVFVRCLTGQLPFSGADTRENTLRLRATDLAAVPEPVGRVLSEGLVLEPSERLGDMWIFRAKLSAALREIDASYPWPNEATISYSGGELELEQALVLGERAQPQVDVSDSVAGASVRARPEHLRTRTLLRPRRFSLRPGMRSAWVLVGAMLLAAGALALRRPVNDAGSPDFVVATAVPAPSLGRVEPGFAILLSPVQPKHLLEGGWRHQTPAPDPSQSSVVRSRASGGEPARTRSRRNSTATDQHPGSIAPGALPAPATSRALGSNRAPIID